MAEPSRTSYQEILNKAQPVILAGYSAQVQYRKAFFFFLTNYATTYEGTRYLVARSLGRLNNVAAVCGVGMLYVG